MNPRRITPALGTAAGALLAAAFLPAAVAFADNAAPAPAPAPDVGPAPTDVYVPEPVPTGVLPEGAPNPETVIEMPALGGLGTDTVTHTLYLNFDTTTNSFVLGGSEFGSEVFVTNTYTIPFFTETSTVFTDGTGALANASNLGVTDDTFWLTLGGQDLIGFETNPMEILTPYGDIPL